MVDLKTTYMGIDLNSPIIVAASSISNMIDRIEKAEAHGAGALVIRSMFEEQAQLEASDGTDASRVYIPSIDHASLQSHLDWTEKTRLAVKMPLIGSLNAVHPDAWTTYAKALEGTGVDALELNFYRVHADLSKTSQDIEQELYDTVANVVSAVNIPVSIKISPYFTSIASVVAQLAERGAKGVVMFNRFLQPDIRMDDLALVNEMTLSNGDENRLPLRWTAILYDRVTTDLCLNTGVHTGKDVLKAILAGAQTVQVASALLTHGIQYIETMHNDMEKWMAAKDYANINDIRGKLSQKNCDDPEAFERAQYMRLIMNQH